MAKMSKYKQLIGKVINDVMVVDYERQERVSKKSGKTYKVTRLYVTADGENMLEIGTASFNKMSFLKRLEKITSKWIYKEQVSEPAPNRQDKEQEKINDLISKGKWMAMMLAKDVNQLNDIYTKLQETVTDEKRFKELGHKYEVILKELQPKTEYFPAVISEKPITGDMIMKHFDTLENTFYYKDLRKVFNGLANIYHPDKGGNAKLFQEFYETYNRQAKVLKRAEDILLTRISGKEYEDTVKGLYDLQRQKEEIYGC